MGPSGAGKTTLLDVIAGRKTGGTITGEILLNGRPKDETFSRYAGYCEQMDSHMPTLTVREALSVSAALRLDEPHEERERHVSRVLEQLLLVGYQDQLLGTPGLDGVAPEVRKLVTIGVELVCKPQVLFLDEPTTGLDSSSALATMRLCKKVARKSGIAVLCTIHQPATEIFLLFDTLLLLQKGGRVAYFGPTTTMPEYLAKMCNGPAIREEENPADYSLTCASAVNFTTGDGGQKTTWSTAADAFEALQLKRQLVQTTATIEAESKSGSINSIQEGGRRGTLPQQVFPQQQVLDRYRVEAEEADEKKLSKKLYNDPYATSSYVQFRVLLTVYFRLHWRDAKVFRTRFLLAIVFGSMVGVLFRDVGNDQVGARARISVIFISLVYAGNVANMAIPTMVMTRPIVFRERGSNAYRLCPYYWAVLCAEIPFVVVQALLFVSTFYFLVGFQYGPTQGGLVHFARFALGFVLLSLLTFSFSHLMASIAPNADVGTILSATCQSVFTLFSGFLLPYASIPTYWRPLYYLSLFRYPLGFFSSNELVGLTFSCPVGDDSPTGSTGSTGSDLPVGAFPVFVGGLADSTSYPPPPRGNGPFATECLPFLGNFTDLHDRRCWNFFCPIRNGEFILERYSMPTTSTGMYEQLGVMLVFFLFLRCATFGALAGIQHISR